MIRPVSRWAKHFIPFCAQRHAILPHLKGKKKSDATRSDICGLACDIQPDSGDQRGTKELKHSRVDFRNAVKPPRPSLAATRWAAPKAMRICQQSRSRAAVTTPFTPHRDASNSIYCLRRDLPKKSFHSPRKQGRDSYAKFFGISDPTRRGIIRSKPQRSYSIASVFWQSSPLV